MTVTADDPFDQPPPTVFDDSRAAVYRPETVRPFVGARRMPAFDPRADRFTPANAWWLANAAHAAYYCLEDLPAKLPDGWSMQRFFVSGDLQAEDCSTEAALLAAPGGLVLAFRGTVGDHPPDLRSDARLILKPFQSDGPALVHTGFLDALDEVWADVSSALDAPENAGLPVWFTGHSLGAALAALAAARRPPHRTVTFGSPRVGDQAFADLCVDLPHDRLVLCSDGVPDVPPPVFYRHVGRLWFCDHHGQWLENPSHWVVSREKSLGAMLYYAESQRLLRLHHDVSVRFLRDHAVVNYARALAAAAI